VSERSLAEIKADLLADLARRAPDLSLEETDPPVKVLEAAAYRELVWREALNAAAAQAFPLFARGANLDHALALFARRKEGESDEEFRERALSAPDATSTAGSRAGYLAQARKARARFRSVGATSPELNTVVVTVLGLEGEGETPPEVLQAVEEALSEEDARPLTDKIVVRSAIIIPYRVSASIIVFRGADPQAALERSRADVRAYVDSRHALGADVAYSALSKALHGEQVVRVEDLRIERLDGENRVFVADSRLSVRRTEASYCREVVVTAAIEDEGDE
jgi:phage-related baseplate assembly protein